VARERIENDLYIYPSELPFRLMFFSSQVFSAPSTCSISSETCVGLHAWVSSARQCERLRQENRECASYRVEIGGEDQGEGGLAHSQEQIYFPSPGDNALSAPSLCYLLSSCSQRIVTHRQCTLGRNNFLDLKFFTPSLSACRSYCLSVAGCRYLVLLTQPATLSMPRYYYHHPVHYSPAPLYCYLYRQCAGDDQEPGVALVLGGRHPGQYFIAAEGFGEVITDQEVCHLGIGRYGSGVVEVETARAGACATYSDGRVLLCGGRSGQETLSSCMVYDLERETWSGHSRLIMAREEASMAMLGSQLYIMGGEGLQSVEVLDSMLETAWSSGPELPFVISRSCAVSTGSSIILAGGQSNQSSSLSLVLSFSKDQREWTEGQNMLQPRRDHACLYVELEDRKGMLVTGGLGEKDEVLASGEFYDVSTGEWSMVSSMVMARTEHVMSLVYGLPTVIGERSSWCLVLTMLTLAGGINGEQFISSMELFDMSESSVGQELEREWRVMSKSLAWQRYQHAVAGVPRSKVRQEREGIGYLLLYYRLKAVLRRQ
jgi:hypothetical protein